MHIYNTFKEAAQYAKEIAQKKSQTVKIERSGDGYVVLIASQAFRRPHDIAATNLDEYIERSRNWEREIEHRKNLARERREEEKKRSDYLKERKIYYESLSEEQLELIWSGRADSSLEEDELRLIRNILRKIKGLDSDNKCNRLCELVST